MPRRCHFVPAGLLFLAAAALTPAAADDAKLRITKADCNRLVKHQPAPGAAYRSGVDAHGRAVPGAEIEGAARIDKAEDVVIVIDINLFDRLGIPPSSESYEAEAVVGVVQLKDGRLLFNGRPLDSEAESVLAESCRRRLSEDG
jgi:hypothetical protein